MPSPIPYLITYLVWAPISVSGLTNGWSALTITCSPAAGLVAKYGRRTVRAALTPALA